MKLVIVHVAGYEGATRLPSDTLTGLFFVTGSAGRGD